VSLRYPVFYYRVLLELIQCSIRSITPASFDIGLTWAACRRRNPGSLVRLIQTTRRSLSSMIWAQDTLTVSCIADPRCLADHPQAHMVDDALMRGTIPLHKLFTLTYVGQTGFPLRDRVLIPNPALRGHSGELDRRTIRNRVGNLGIRPKWGISVSTRSGTHGRSRQSSSRLVFVLSTY